MSIEKIKPTLSLDQERLKTLEQLIPEAFTEGQINLAVMEELFVEHLEDESRDTEHFGLSWPGKRESRRLASTPNKGTLVPAPGEGIDEDTTKNIFIEGDNLEALKLLQKSCSGQVKAIYIDPPYNTGNDFIYKDDFKEPLEEYLKKTGQTDEEGNLLTTNTKADGRFHSNWLNMMYPRLRLARNLLRDDGVIFVSIDDNEVHNIRHVMNEIFGEENFVATFTWRRRTSSALADKRVSVDHEYLIVYQRGGFEGFFGDQKSYSAYQNSNNDPKGLWMLDNLTVGMTKEQRPNQFYDLIDPKTGKVYAANPNRVWAFIQGTMSQAIAEGRVVFPENTNKRPMLKRYKKDLKSDVNPISTWMKGAGSSTENGDSIEFESGLNAEGTRLIQELFGASVFSYSKPVSLLTSLAKHTTSSNDIVLDFFAGSGTTAQAVLELNRADGGNRRFICVQLPEPLETRRTLADGTALGTIADIVKERIRRVSKEIKEELNRTSNLHRHDLDLGFKVFKLQKSNFKAWQDYQGENIEQLQDLFTDFETPLIDGWKEQDVLTEVHLREGFPLNSTISPAADFQKNKVVRVESSFCAHNLYISLDSKIAKETIRQVALLTKEDTFICLDSALTDNGKLQLSDVCKITTI